MISFQGLSTSTAGWQTKIFDTIQKAWQPQLDAKFSGLPKGTHPNFSKILELATDGTASFRKEFTDWIKAATKQTTKRRRATTSGRSVIPTSMAFSNPPGSSIRRPTPAFGSRGTTTATTGWPTTRPESQSMRSGRNQAMPYRTLSERRGN